MESEGNVINYGNGIVCFKKAVEINYADVIERIKPMEDEAKRKNFKFVYDENGNEKYAINQGGFQYSIEEVNAAPLRVENIPKDLADFFENVTYEYLLRYIEIFPSILQCLWWKINGHILAYSPGGRLGVHSDNDVNYRYGNFPTQEHATRVVVSSVVFINGHPQINSEPGALEFSGGEFRFEYTNSIIKPASGDILFFPANYVGAHEVLPVINGKRYTYLSGFAQGSAQPEKAIDPQRNAEGSGGQVWLETIVNDYESYLQSKYDGKIPDGLDKYKERPIDHQN